MLDVIIYQFSALLMLSHTCMLDVNPSVLFINLVLLYACSSKRTYSRQP